MSASRTVTRYLSTHLAALTAVVVLSVAGVAGAVPFRPDVVAKLKTEGKFDRTLRADLTARDAGVDAPAPLMVLQPGAGGKAIVPDRHCLVILTDFSDNVADQVTYPSSHYQSMLFSVGEYSTGSMRDWYLENSYGQFNVTGVTTVWVRLPQTYAYYVDGQAGYGTYPQNVQKLVEDAVTLVDATVDFSQFDNDGPDGIPSSGDDDGDIDTMFIVHAGPGRETTGSDNNIHSHAWVTKTPPVLDGVRMYRYCIQPEDGRIGVYGHEFGHMLGLPDLYDTDYTSEGVGSWCMMAGGTWGGGGDMPTHFVSWCKQSLGFLTPIVPLVNEYGVALPQVESSPTVYKLWTGGYPAQQYFLVENRQVVLGDIALPGSGLLICHVDDSIETNTDEDHPHVWVEQADGLNEMYFSGSADAGDPWPGSTDNRDFSDVSLPNSNDYNGDPTQVAVLNISSSAAVMSADLQVETLPILAVEQVVNTGIGVIDPGETWTMAVTVRNRGADANLVEGILTSSHADVTITAATSNFGTIAPESAGTGASPFGVQLAAGSGADGVPFTLTMQAAGVPAQAEEVIVGVGAADAVDFFEWTHANQKPAYGDQWHVSTARSHDGAYSWKCGSTTTGQYANRVDAVLVTRSFALANVAAVRFWHWIDANSYNSYWAWDGGIVEASVDGGSWTQITPVGGYPCAIANTSSSPFAVSTPCYSGTQGWSEARIDLTGLVGDQVRLRFRFGTNSSVTAEGWYIDDMTIETSYVAGVDEPGVPAEGVNRFSLSQNFPNPFNPATKIGFSLAETGHVSLRVFDTAGRLVRTLVDESRPAGVNSVMWDGTGDSGKRLASGLYIYRIETEKSVSSRSMMLLE